ncbi:hypothetical protein P8605_01120 [Streptomyces sp. T-3]|nr:hypothetical protein [Streptomyces sp. T-3]
MAGGDWQQDVLRELKQDGAQNNEPVEPTQTVQLVRKPGGGVPAVAPVAPQPAAPPAAPAPDPREGQPAPQLSGPVPSGLVPPGHSAQATQPAPAAPADPHTAPPAQPQPRTTAQPAPRPAPRDPRVPMPTPESVPTVDPRLAAALSRPVRGDSAARRTGRSLRSLAASASGEVAEQTRLARELQQPVTTGRVIAVTSIRGGVGKTTVSALLARTYNHYRHDPVLALEADAALGTLPVRLGAETVRWSCTDLAGILEPSMLLTDVTGYLVPVTDGGWLLPAGQGRIGPPLDVATYRSVSLALRRYFGVTVVDCESLPGDVARTAMATAHARVVVAPVTAEGVNGTRQVLDWLARLPEPTLAHSVVALCESSPHIRLDVKAAIGHLRETGVSVVHVPYDRHLGAGGPVINSMLSQASRQAAAQLAAEALQFAVRTP